MCSGFDGGFCHIEFCFKCGRTYRLFPLVVSGLVSLRRSSPLQGSANFSLFPQYFYSSLIFNIYILDPPGESALMISEADFVLRNIRKQEPPACPGRSLSPGPAAGLGAAPTFGRHGPAWVPCRPGAPCPHPRSGAEMKGLKLPPPGGLPSLARPSSWSCGVWPPPNRTSHPLDLHLQERKLRWLGTLATV